MEKRFLIAASLSFLVLFTWSSIFKSPPVKKTPTELQVFENKEDKSFYVKKDPTYVSSISTISSENKIIEKITKIETNKFLLEFSNIGGTLKNFSLKEYKANFPVENILTIDGYENYQFSLNYFSPQKIVYLYEDEDKQILKTYKIFENDYIVQSEISYLPKKLNIIREEFKISNFLLNTSILNLKNKNDSNYSRDRSLFEYVVKSDNDIYRKGNAFKFTEKDSKEENKEVDWVGFRDRYFSIIIKSESHNSSYKIKYLDNEKLNLYNNFYLKNSSLDKNYEFKYTIFIGPEKSDLLKKYKLGFEDIKKYYRFWLFDAMGKIVYNFVHFLHKIIPNWGICIIILSIAIYLFTYPLTISSMFSMKKMQSLQPKISNLREKYKNNPQKLNKEIVELYKENKVNPLGGCLPLLLQMPIFIGLYQALWRDVDFNGATFLWIKDLSAPDRLFIFPFSIPFLGNEFNILPILMTFIMFIQQKLSAKNMVLSDQAQIEQQKIMNIFMPMFLGVIFYKFASGLNIYFTFFYAFSTFNQWKIYNGTKI